MATDRQYMKLQQAGALQTTGATNAIGEVGKAHSRPYPMVKAGTENAATNVAQTFLCVLNRKSQFGLGSNGTVKFITGSTVTKDTSNYAVTKVFKLDSAGANSTLVASWNTHNSAQGTITANVPASLSVVANADATVDAGSSLYYTIDKIGTGVQIAVGVFLVDPEEV